MCPYYGSIYDEEAEGEIAYCKFVERSDICLLDDCCKICGENMDERENNETK